MLLLLGGGLFSYFNNSSAEVGDRGPDRRPSEWDWQRRTFPYGQADDDAHLVAVRQAQQMREAQRFKNDGILSSAQWELMGPTNIGGRITDIEFNPKNPAIVYAAAASGGIFKSLDTGNTWKPVFDDQAVFSMGDIAIDPQNPETIYVGTGEANAQHNAFPGGGVFKSTNGGKSWTNIGLVGTVAIGRVVIDPKNPQRIFVAALGSGFGYNSNRGIFRSDDGGKTWAKKLYINDSTGAIDVVVNPENSNIVYASVWERNRRIDYRNQFGVASGLFKSANGGDTWEKLDEANGLPDSDAVPVGRIGLAISASSPDVVYASYTNGYEYIGLFKTTNGGQSWDSTISVPTSHGFSWYFGQVRVRPDNSDVVYVLDTDFLRSSDGGTNWDLVLGYDQQEIHVDQHALAFHPQNPDYVISGNDGGMNISHDGGATWRKVMNLPITQFYEISLDAQNPQKIYGGTQDNNTIRTQTGSKDDWEAILGGDGFYSIVDPTNPDIIYAEYQNGKLLKSIDGGMSFVDVLNGITEEEARNWSTPVVMDPDNNSILYYGAEHIYKSTDGAESWTAISPELSPAESYLYGTITTIAVAPSNSDFIYAGTDDGHIWLSYDAGQSWYEMTNGTPNRWVTRLVVDPNDENTVYATFSGLKWKDDTPHVFKTEDMGGSWQNISGNLPQAPVNAFAIDPFKTDILYLGSDVGAFVSFNGGDSWSVLGEGMPITSVYDLKIHPTEHFLVAGTHGRSAYKINLDNLTGIEEDGSFKEILNMVSSPNPFKNEMSLLGNLPTAGKIQLKIFDSQGKEVRIFNPENLDAGPFSRMWDGKDSNGKAVAAGAYMAQMLYYTNGKVCAETQKVLKTR
ncbi:MAG: FlgD immunoglobulin-like domain containing protein [Bacteroidota bacterium]